jgi:hypothetical protein
MQHDTPSVLHEPPGLPRQQLAQQQQQPPLPRLRGGLGRPLRPALAAVPILQLLGRLGPEHRGQVQRHRHRVAFRRELERVGQEVRHHLRQLGLVRVDQRVQEQRVGLAVGLFLFGGDQGAGRRTHAPRVVHVFGRQEQFGQRHVAIGESVHGEGDLGLSGQDVEGLDDVVQELRGGVGLGVQGYVVVFVLVVLWHVK